MWTTLKGWLDGLLGKNAVTKAHMTFARTSMGNRIKQTSVILRRQLWIWPIIAVALLTLIGYTITRHAQYGWTQKAAHWVMYPFYNDHTAYAAALALFIPPVFALSRL
ncbi:MAG: hypothetical protein ACK5PZ_07805, partial [Pirellula sp.]